MLKATTVLSFHSFDETDVVPDASQVELQQVWF